MKSVAAERTAAYCSQLQRNHQLRMIEIQNNSASVSHDLNTIENALAQHTEIIERETSL